MAQNVLEARITADISGLESGLKKAEKLQDDYTQSVIKAKQELKDQLKIVDSYKEEINKLETALKKSYISQTQFDKAVAKIKQTEKEASFETKRLTDNLKNLQDQQKGVSSNSDDLAKSTTSASNSTFQLSRIMQQAPRGMNIVGDNIVRLVENFGQLKKETGGTGAALKAMGASFLGPAGIIFAVSTITTLLATYGDELFNSANATNELAESNADFVASAKTEIQTLNSLLSIATNEAESKERRERALNRINKDYGGYLANLTLEPSKTDVVWRKIDGLTQSLISQAKVRGAEAVLEEKYKQLALDTAKAQERAAYRAGERVSETRKDLKTQINSYQTLLTSLKEQQKEGRDVGKAIEFTTSKIEELKNSANDIDALYDSDLSSFVQDFTKDTVKEIEDFEKVFSSVVSDSLNFDTADDKGVISDRLKEAQKEGENLAKLLAKIDKQIEDTELGEGAAQNLYDANQIAKELGSTAKDLSSLGGLDFDPQQGIPKTVAELEKVEELIKSISKEFPKIDTSGLGAFNSEQLTTYINQLNRAKETTQLFANAAGSAFSALGQSIATSFQTGNAALDAFIGSLINGLTQMLTQLVTAQIAKSLVAKKDIATQQGVSNANAITIASSASAALGPAGIGAFPALLASQIALVNGAFAPLYAFAQGGIVPGGAYSGDKIPAMLNSGEMVLNNGQQAKLFKALDGRMSSLQGNGSALQIVGEGVLRGRDQYMQFKREEKKHKRYYN